MNSSVSDNEPTNGRHRTLFSAFVQQKKAKKKNGLRLLNSAFDAAVKTIEKIVKRNFYTVRIF